jgi:hypothetical protein
MEVQYFSANPKVEQVPHLGNFFCIADKISRAKGKLGEGTITDSILGGCVHCTPRLLGFWFAAGQTGSRISEHVVECNITSNPRPGVALLRDGICDDVHILPEKIEHSRFLVRERNWCNASGLSTPTSTNFV